MFIKIAINMVTFLNSSNTGMAEPCRCMRTVLELAAPLSSWPSPSSPPPGDSVQRSLPVTGPNIRQY